jgi:pimeloyl-ACP methyl ester carboxylesterase
MRRSLSVLFTIGMLAVAGHAHALNYQGGANQFAGGFSPSYAPFGGFGGGSCSTSRVPVVFIHGNGDEAKNWDYPASTGVPSVYDTLRANGYNDCELFGITWLSSSERESPQYNYHKPAKAEMVGDFIRDVLAYTGSSKVDIVGHSLGVTVALHALKYEGLWSKVRRFVGIAGGMRGLTACYSVGYANPAAPTCGSENIYNSDIFGFYPHSAFVWNWHLADGGFRDEPGRRTGVSFYSIRAGYHDQILCSTAGYMTGCDTSALFDSYSNVRAQLNVGHGSTAAQLDFDLSDWSIYKAGGGDLDGVGHFRARNNTGRILLNMLTSTCTGTQCCSGYGASCK